MRHLGVAGIWDDVRRTSGSNASGSWRRFPDGTIEQTGTVSVVNGSGTITYPIPFTSSCEHIALTSISSGLAATSSVSAWLAATPGTATASISGRAFTTVLGALSIGAGSFNVQWRAVGR